MKATLRIPTNESYAYIEVDFEGTEQEIVDKHREFIALAKGDEGLGTHDWVKLRDEYFSKRVMDPDLQELFEQCSPEQRAIINQIKLAIKNNK